MRRATWGWAILCLVLIFLLSGCRLQRAAMSPPPTAETLAVTATDTAPAPSANGTAEAIAEAPATKPTKPAGEAIAATPVATPRPAADPALDDWTMMLYMSATEALDATALDVLNSLEAADSVERSNVVVQLDRQSPTDGSDSWGGTRRFHIVADDGDAEISSRIVGEPGPLNMGDPDSLTEFIVWTQQAFPAKHFALVIWGENNGWRGLATDPGDMDDLSMSDLDGALQRAVAERGATALDVIVLDGSMMASLEVLNAVQPHARFAAAAYGLLPPSGGDYGAFFEVLDAEENVSPEHFAQLVAATVDGQGNSHFFAYDLSQLARVNEALQGLSNYLVQSAELSAMSFARAQRSAELATLQPPGRGGSSRTVDLRRFAEHLVQFAPLPELSRLSASVGGALDALVVSGVGDGRGALPITVLPQGQIDDPLYAQVDGVEWQAALRAFNEARAELDLPPQGQLSVQTGDYVGAQLPALVGLELRTTGTDGASLAVLQEQDDGRFRLLSVEPLQPDAERDGYAGAWPPGITQMEKIWDTTAAYVSDGANGGFAPLWPVAGEPGLLVASARFLPAGRENGAREAVMLLDGVSKTFHSAWQLRDQAAAVQPLSPEPGDSFQLYNVYYGAGDSLSYEPGVTLVYSDSAEIAFDYFPLPSGEYQIGIFAEEAGGGRLVAPQTVTVNNEDLQPGYRAYLNIEHGFRFLYPLSWSVPVFDGRRVATAARQRGPALTVSIYPEAPDASAAQLKAQTLDTFGDLDILYEETISVSGEEALFTAYGYDAADGPHTGVFITFVDDSQAVGYVIDIDGLALDEEVTLDTASQIASSWLFVPIRSGAWTERWVTTELGPLTVTLPPSYEHSTLQNGWERFTEADSFLAVRRDGISGEGRPALASHWAEVASRGVNAFVAEASQPFALGESVWSRVEFRYDGDDGPVAGLILATIYAGEEMVAWVETPADDLLPRMNDHFLPSLAGLLPVAPGTAGVLYEAAFDETGDWGVGRQDGATGAVQDGVYQLAVNAPRGFFWAGAGVSLAEGEYEVDVTQTSGSFEAAYGLLLGANVQTESFYLFEISADGYIWIGRCQRSCGEADTLVGDGWLASDAVHRGLQATNRLRVRVTDSQMVFYVNDVLIATVDDIVGIEGDVGFAAETLGEGGLSVQFDNLRVSSP